MTEPRNARDEGACGYEWNTEMEDPESWLTDHVCELTVGHEGAHECRCGNERWVRD